MLSVPHLTHMGYGCNAKGRTLKVSADNKGELPYDIGTGGRESWLGLKKTLNTNYKTAKANYIPTENFCWSKIPYKEREEGSHGLGKDTRNTANGQSQHPEHSKNPCKTVTRKSNC